jgi:hypothetical protein
MITVPFSLLPLVSVTAGTPVSARSRNSGSTSGWTPGLDITPNTARRFVQRLVTDQGAGLGQLGRSVGMQRVRPMWRPSGLNKPSPTPSRKPAGHRSYCDQVGDSATVNGR